MNESVKTFNRPKEGHIWAISHRHNLTYRDKPSDRGLQYSSKERTHDHLRELLTTVSHTVSHIYSLVSHTVSRHTVTGADPERGGPNKGEVLHYEDMPYIQFYSIYEITNAGWKDKYPGLQDRYNTEASTG